MYNELTEGVSDMKMGDPAMQKIMGQRRGGCFKAQARDKKMETSFI